MTFARESLKIFECIPEMAKWKHSKESVDELNKYSNMEHLENYLEESMEKNI